MAAYRPLPTPRAETKQAYHLRGSVAVGARPVPSPALSTGISPTYDLLDGYSEPDSADIKEGLGNEAQPKEMDNPEHRQTWKQIGDTHDGLIAQHKESNHVWEGSVAIVATPDFSWNSSNSSNGVQGIANNTNAFFDRMPMLMKALDSIARVHAFTGVAILTFKVVYELELKRRDNNKKVLAVYGEMSDMMAALVQLHTIKSEDEVGPDGVSIKARMEHLLERTATDIRECANTCDTYLKKKPIVKILTCPSWDTILCNLSAAFHKRRAEFEFALSMHTGLDIEANAKLDEIEGTAQQTQDRLDDMLAYFHTALSPEYEDIAARVRGRGGLQAVMDNERLLRELIHEFRGHVDGTLDIRGRQDVAFDMEELKLELREDIELAVERNAQTFSRKFEMQRQQIVDELARVVHREGDRVINAIPSRPHDRIIDADLYAIWKEMGWRGSTKARHFVLALRDHFREKEEEKKRNDRIDVLRTKKEDGWALEWINVTRLQPIVEAFNDDASNFITVSEANELTTARPRDWSLLHWLAYWAIGWQISATMYRDKINNLFAKMFSLKAHIHPAVRNVVDTYLHSVWTRVSELTSSIEPYYPLEGLREKFQSYIDDEEQRLRERLEAVRYDIDAMDTLTLVTGPGRIEKYVFPILYLLLKKDYEVMRIARQKVISRVELLDAANTVQWVLQAVEFRYKDLQDIFRQQKLDPRQQFKGFACGLFEHWRNSEGLWSRNVEFPNVVYNDDGEAQDINSDDILNYPLDNDDWFDPTGYDAPRFSPTEKDMTSKWPLRALLGSWSGFMSKGNLYPCQPMLSIQIHAVDSIRFEATSRTANGTAYHLQGRYISEVDGRICYTFVIKYATRFAPLYFRGYLHDKDRTFSGTWGTSPEAANSESKIIKRQGDNHSSLVVGSTADRFVFKRLPAAYMCCRPDPIEFQINRPRALWRYATTIVRELVSMRRFSWTYFERRRDDRKRYIELLIRLNYAELVEEELMELARIRKTLTTADARLYETRYQYELRTTAIHLDVTCDHCENTIVGSRIVCLDCDSNKTLNLCDDPRCRSSEIDVEKRPDLPAPHLPGHAVFKVRTMLHLREFGRMNQAARMALKSARRTFNEVTELLTDEVLQNPALRRQARVKKIAQASLSCIICRKQVSKPCWYCITCEDDVFICLECDKRGSLTVGAHDKLHALVRCQDDIRYGPMSLDQRLELMDQRFTTMEHRFDAMDTRFDGMQSRFTSLEKRVFSMDDKLTRMEEMLGAMFVRSTNAQFTSRRTGSDTSISPAWNGFSSRTPQAAKPYPRPLPIPSPSP
ncbi:hypothetical protein BD311DRAFT_779599 [Dichomitus squalens]|uniref:Uncharacterized protein n=1 Tax=Dichomitus squalens TaxID=114155 RepID=A0A4Q9MK70_9APHY|nr:hypothetical protein BD311DRAFT_779599 [Dichomitus squalens]